MYIHVYIIMHVSLRTHIHGVGNCIKELVRVRANVRRYTIARVRTRSQPILLFITRTSIVACN